MSFYAKKKKYEQNKLKQNQDYKKEGTVYSIENTELKLVTPHPDELPEVDFTKFITQGMAKLDNSRPEDGYFHPSELGKCSRTVYWNKLYGKPDNKKEAFSPIGKMSLTLGHAIHEMIEQSLYRSDIGLDFKHEVKLKSEQERIIGTTDGIYTDKEGRKYILEFKSCNSKWFAQYQFVPDKKHVRQVHCYMFMTGARVAYIIYYCKDNNRMMQHRIEYEDKTMFKILDRLRHIRTCILGRELPMRREFITCKDDNDLRKQCANYMRCKDYFTKNKIPTQENTLMA